MDNLIIVEPKNKGTYHESQKASIYNYRNNNRQKYNEYQKQLYEKQMADPEFRKAHNEKKRIYQALRREQTRENLARLEALKNVAV
jgi:hypothetical protein